MPNWKELKGTNNKQREENRSWKIALENTYKKHCKNLMGCVEGDKKQWKLNR